MCIFAKTIFIFTCLLLGEVYVASSPAKIGGRIIGGNVAEEGQFPFVAALEVVTDTTVSLCGGSLISTNWILTSALCLIDLNNVTIQLGSLNLTAPDSNAVITSSTQFVIHPEFDPATISNDIGLVQLDPPVELTPNIQPIRLASINLPTILAPTAVGWGETSNDGSEYPAELHYVQLSALTTSECQEIYGDFITDSVLCVNGDNQGTCFGDNGTPLVARPLGSTSLQQFGVASFIGLQGCGVQPSGYTRTYPSLDWIKSITGLE